MGYKINEVIDFIEENDVKFIKLAFCDVFGQLKTISIISSEFISAVETGVSFDASAVKGFMNIAESDLLLFPDLNTLSVLPWRPQQGRVIRFYCDIKYPDGRIFEGDARRILKNAIAELKKENLKCKIGSESEFYLFELDEKYKPTLTPYDNGSYLDVFPLDKGENLRREVCLTLEEMNIYPETSHHEQGPGQNEIDFKYNHALAAADDLVTFKSVVKTVAYTNGVFASFMPKPIHDKSGNGLHINLSLSREGNNIFKLGDEHCEEAESFIAGILNRICDMTLFLNPITNSYKRLGSFEAPKYVTWSHQNRSQLIRIPAADPEKARMELRSADSAANPYLAYALLIYAGIEGIKNKTPLCPPTNMDLFAASDDDANHLKTIPLNLGEAVEFAKSSEFIKEHLPAKIIDTYVNQKSQEWNYFSNCNEKEQFEQESYFEYI